MAPRKPEKPHTRKLRSNDNWDRENRASDADAFAREMADVVPLRRDPRGRARRVPIVTSPPSSNVPSPPPGTRGTKGRGGTRGALNDFAAPGIDRRTIRELKRGEYSPAAQCDLHGMTAAEAIALVRTFLASSRSRGLRCVCIVHGRGLHSTGNVSILKTRVRELLSSDPAVLAFSDAPAADGGPGAAYVLLRR